ncbi:MAG: hypothetical protein ACE5GL_02305 [Calditrichia bacterium]
MKKIPFIYPVLFFSIILFNCQRGLVKPAAESCPFDYSELHFTGAPLAQAKCLLRPVEKYAHLSEPLDSLPAPLERLIGNPVKLDKSVVRQYLRLKGVKEKDLGGSLDMPLSRTNDNDPEAPYARYFIIHDTSTPNYLDQPIPPDINKRGWKHNDLKRWAEGEKSKGHVFINRLGESITAVDFSTPWRGTKMEVKILKKRGKGLCLNIEMVQPRRSDPNGPPGNDAIAPIPGFTDAQLERLALVYIAASVRRGRWLIPAYHAAFDAGIPDAHDDPQNFDLKRWAALLNELIIEIETISINEQA